MTAMSIQQPFAASAKSKFLSLILSPMISNFRSTANPDSLMRHHMVEEAHECISPCWMAGYSAVQTDAHEFWMLLTFSHQEIKGRAQALVKRLAIIHSRSGQITEIIIHQRVRYDQM